MLINNAVEISLCLKRSEQITNKKTIVRELALSAGAAQWLRHCAALHGFESHTDRNYSPLAYSQFSCPSSCRAVIEYLDEIPC